MSNNKKVLVVVDMQDDFIDGSLGSEQAQDIVPNVVKKIEEFDGDIVVTQDTHTKDYLSTEEGRNLPISHCIVGTHGHAIHESVMQALAKKMHDHKVIFVEKPTFGSVRLPSIIFDEDYSSIEVIGLCTDICVVSNVLLLKAFSPERKFIVDSSCCAGATPDTHLAALQVLKSCHIEVN